MGGMTTSMRDDEPNVDDPGYSLKQETTEFLTQLSQSLSDENDNLIGLVRTAITTLKELQGIPEELRQGEDLSMIREEDENTQSGMLHALPTSYETLASNMDTCLDNLRHLLTNPNFVPLEEVEAREEEILRLRAGWEKMEVRLREAFSLMETWRKRMADGGDTINLDELKMGLGLGLGLKSMNKEDMSMIAEDEDEEDEPEEEDTSSVFDEDPDEADELSAAETSHVSQKAPKTDMLNLKLEPNPPALRETNGNPRSPTRSPRKVAFSASIPNTPSQIDIENTEASSIDLVGVDKLTRPTPRSEQRTSRPTSQDEQTPYVRRCNMLADQICNLASKFTFSSPSTLDSFLLSSPLISFDSTSEDSDDFDKAKKRVSSPHVHPDEPSPKLTVQDKLKVAQAEAEAAAVAESLRARLSPAKKQHHSQGEEGVEIQQRRPRRNSRASPIKTRIGGRPKRRKSTLTPEELDNLLGV